MKHSEIQKNKKEVIVISGSSGLAGTALIHKLAPQYRIAGFDNTGYPYPPAEAECVCMDITDEKHGFFSNGFTMNMETKLHR